MSSGLVQHMIICNLEQLLVVTATLEVQMSYNGAVILKHRCGYIQNGVVISCMVRLY